MKQVLIAFDQLVNAVFGGWADESLSSRAWRTRDQHPYLYRVIDAIFFWDVNHCEESYQSERDRIHLPPELRNK